MTLRGYGLAIAGLAFTVILAPSAFSDELIKPAEFGTVREVVGAKLPAVKARVGCAAAQAPIKDGPCFDTIKVTASSQRVVTLSTTARVGDRISGDYGRDFKLYDVRLGDKGIEARPVDLPTSDVRVPRDCYALKGEGVGYVLSQSGNALIAEESQYVVCGGGAHTPTGPYDPRGAPIPSDGTGWPRTETTLAEAPHRYLAVPGTTCDGQYSIKTTWCAKPAVVYMDSHPDVKELDLIAARAAVRSGDVLVDKGLDQWVMKRKTKGYKADGRWFKKSMFTDGNGCWATEPVRWYVGEVADGLDIAEKAMSRCGAAPAPIPTETYLVYGDDYYILKCNWNRRGDNTAGACADEAKAYLNRERRKSAVFVVLYQRAGDGDRLYEGSYVGYDVINAELKDDRVKFSDGGEYTTRSTASRSGCRQSASTEAETHGFVLVRSRGILWARAYQWMDCPVY